jgi:hypothetical protein
MYVLFIRLWSWYRELWFPMSAEQIDVGESVFLTEFAKDYTQVSLDVPVVDYFIKLVNIPFGFEDCGDIIEGEMVV